MHLSRLQTINFRSLENIEVEFDSLVNVVIGPNAVGKTTILEAIRLAKAILAPRTQNETQQTMISLGLTSPHLPQRLLPRALTHDPDKPTIIKCAFKATTADIAQLEGLLPTLIKDLALQNIGLNFANPAQAMNFLNSPQGALAQQGAQAALTTEIGRVKATGKLELNLTIDYRRSLLSGEFPGQQLLFGALEQHLDPSKTLFSYFPADRALPTGEQPVQLGMADTAQQLESYNSQPQLKYNRLKNMIFNTIIGQPNGRQQLSEQFSLIFERVLKGRSLGEIGINAIGMLSIPIIDVESGRSFDIDGLSSGEKGLILTSLLIARSIADNGLILLDEPELHLNPAVCRDLLQFLVDEFAVKKNMQAIICSHSAEILAGAFERTNCSLFHLKSGTSLAKIRQQDQGEIRDALRRLGSSESEALLYKGTVSVEGIHDAEILQSGFDAIVRRFIVKPFGGRSSIESDIRDLQKAEKKAVEVGFHYFLFDLDGKPTLLNDSTHVRLRQLKRYCLENYLLDAEIITDLTREKEFADQPLPNVTETTQLMKRLALSQLNVVASREVFKQLGLEAVCFDMKVLERDTEDAASQLLNRIEMITTQFEVLKGAGFKEEYQKQVNTKLTELKAQWDDKWRDHCNGKLLLEDMRKDGHLKGDLLKLKRRLATEMRLRSTDSYNALVGILRDLLPTN
jgi:predicted ATPase